MRQAGEMSAAQIAFDMELGEAFECRENEYREETKALAVKAVEERAAKAAAAEERAAKAAAKAAEKAAEKAAPKPAAAAKAAPMKRKLVKCDHGRVRSQCKDCGGSGVCEHGRRRYSCKDCGGSGS